MQRTAAMLGKHTRAWSVPFFSPGLSRLWVTLVTQTPRALVAPLIQSLRHPMVTSRDDFGALLGRTGLGFEDSLQRALDDEAAAPAVKREAQVAALGRERRQLRVARAVRSIQRLPLPAGRDAAWVARSYAAWLPRLLWPIVKVQVDDTGSCRFSVPLFRRPLLDLRFEPVRSAPDRQLFAIDGGLLVDRRGEAEPGRLEFREVLDRRFVLAAIHEYRPALPWPVYAATQALLHLWVMGRFSRYLARRADRT
jgi:hypothetical protein